MRNIFRDAGKVKTLRKAFCQSNRNSLLSDGIDLCILYNMIFWVQCSDGFFFIIIIILFALRQHYYAAKMSPFPHTSNVLLVLIKKQEVYRSLSSFDPD